MRKMQRRGQSTLELAIMLGVVILGIVGLQLYIKYAAAGRLKSSADSLSQTLFNPHNGDTVLTVKRISEDVTKGGATRNGSGAGQTVSTTAADNDVTNRQDYVNQQDGL